MTINLTARQKIRHLLSMPYRVMLNTIGINPITLLNNFRGLPRYVRDWIEYNSQINNYPHFQVKVFDLHPKLSDRYAQPGVATGDYFHQDLWMAKKIFLANPSEHWDIGSRIDGFIAHLLTFRSVNVIDIRKLESKVPGLTFHQGDVTKLFLSSNSILSLSCLHAMEHVGLGRYGDAIDPLGYLQGIKELQRVLAPGGKLYFSVPIGRERLEFNAHRIFNPLTVIDCFDKLNLVQFAAIDNERGELIETAKPEDFVDIRYACGLFIFEKPI
jgi:SAM-dependent methyltransferase